MYGIPNPPGGQLPLKGGHHARLWTLKMDPKQVIHPFNFSHPKQLFGHVSPTLNKYFQIKCKIDTLFK